MDFVKLEDPLNNEQRCYRLTRVKTSLVIYLEGYSFFYKPCKTIFPEPPIFWHKCKVGQRIIYLLRDVNPWPNRTEI